MVFKEFSSLAAVVSLVKRRVAKGATFLGYYYYKADKTRRAVVSYHL
ncbi:hypothetical protein COLO4_30005 [Corchorus olitorius]|uniref:Uncharacterized protein n=1 Tax=Corchorus olitorius TaxID=93759 RepID=A0A1R3HBM1_9ROSI|nr:hypothetical protein COLO4_30005 [Corchorus olitorius]